ncbi:hypothetical protein OIE13_05745 [Streptosporangium sp. NBC_01810]|uniref:hypothetical protein n=1 Tax=Streptosporangium sp. NBC_01810 TaxID=2975951 RepID=UPI002DD8C20B|nr:hypothetical protein [Streptosporangium sp. NBC_01810]WSA27375.1 hypothetical protein OIE13_05745 [Streptosporangium sp. NBC_01810]
MDALSHLGVTEDEMREVIKEVHKTSKVKIEKPTPYFRAMAKNNDLPGYLADVRAAAARRAAYAARQAQPPPAAPKEPSQPSVTPEEKEALLAATRELLDAARRSQGQRRPTSPTRVIPQRIPNDVLRAVTAADAARAELLQGGDFDRWMKAAREKLGKDADRDEAVILAASLRRTTTPALGSPT